jgi:GNAT superfamily N-acetyltransferase
MTIQLLTLTGSDLEPYIPDLARLRIRVFRDYPYLYEGSEDYEARYLQTYMRSKGALAILALDDRRVIGASTGVPMSDETAEFKQPFLDRGIDPDRLFYCGESILLPDYRGQGIYRQFFAGREQHAREQGFNRICFCGVLRPADDPRRPADFQPLDPVWQHFGYSPRQDLIAHFPWREVGAAETTSHPMMFWLKDLR